MGYDTIAFEGSNRCSLRKKRQDVGILLKTGAGVKRAVLIAGKTDLRLGIDGLMMLAQFKYGYNVSKPYNIFLFCGNRRDRIKVLYFDGQGMVLMTKRLIRGRYKWPRDTNEAIDLTQEQYQQLIHCEEIDLSSDGTPFP